MLAVKKFEISFNSHCSSLFSFSVLNYEQFFVIISSTNGLLFLRLPLNFLCNCLFLLVLA